jgi:hypothetical protein
MPTPFHLTKTLFSSFSLALLFSLCTACGGGEKAGGNDSLKTDTTKVVKEVVTTEINRELTDIAYLLAGFKVDSSSKLNAVMNTPQWQTHHAAFSKTWDKLTQQQFSKVRTWASTELDGLAGANGNIYYPFGGPDFLYINTLFPGGASYTLTGLEPVGEVPPLATMNATQLTSSLSMIDRVLNDILTYSFFRTIDMEADFRNTNLKGVIPVLLVFLAVKDNEIVSLENVKITDAGELVAKGPDESMTGYNAVRITFRKKGETTDRRLIYVSTDVSNEGLVKTPGYKAYVEKLNHPITYLKAASYLMHRETFSTVRNLILDGSTAVLQDDSGMQVSFFMNDKWKTTFYGLYTAPISLFSSRYQADLRKIYTDGKGIKPLDFGIGYQFKVSNLMLAVKAQ